MGKNNPKLNSTVMLAKNNLRRYFSMLKDAEWAFWDMIAPRSVIWEPRRTHLEREDQKRHWMYPSTASEPENKFDSFTDFRTAFKESMYNVRHAESHVKMADTFQISHLPLNQSRSDYLVSMGVLKEEEKNDETAFQNACDEYYKTTGYMLDRRYHVVKGEEVQNQFAGELYMPESLEGKRARVRGLWEANRITMGKIQENHRIQVKELFSSLENYYEQKTWDMCDNHPRYRQGYLDCYYLYDDIEKKWANQKKLTLYKGSVKKWSVLDDSHSLDNRTTLQKHVGDSRSVTPSLPETESTTAIEVRRETMFVDDNENVNEVELPLKNQYL